MFHDGIHLNTVFTGHRRMKRTVSHQYLLALMGQISTDIMFSSFTRKPGHTECNIADALTFISQFINISLSRYLQGSSCLHVISLSREEPGQVRQIRKHFTDLRQADALQLHINVLQRYSIVPVWFYPESHVFVIRHIDIGVQAHVFMEVYPVVMIDEVELSEGNNGIFRYQRKSKPIAFSVSFDQWTDVHTEKYPGFAFRIFIA